MALPGWAMAALIVVLLGVLWMLVYAAGGTHTAFPHAFYLPIVLAGSSFGAGGALVTALVAGLLLGPVMPLDVSAGVEQPAFSWLTRAVLFALVGACVGALFTSQQRTYMSALTARLEHDLTGGMGDAASPGDVLRVRTVLADRSYHPVFQPIYALGDGRLWAVEALTRFDTGPREPPDVWFARGRRAGLEVGLDLAVMEAALAAASKVLPADVPLSLNCSPGTICDPRLPNLLARFPPRRIILEITEHEVVDDYRDLGLALPRLRERGITVAVDDTGAGFANLRHVLRLAPEIIKLDISLTQGLRHDPVRRTLAECLARFASRTGSQLIAEGIEDPTDLEAWRELGAGCVQGYLLGRPSPLPVAERSRWLIPEAANTIDLRDGLRVS